MSFYLDNSINFFCLANQLNKNVLYFLIYEMMAAYTNPYNFYQKNVLRMTRFSVFFVNVQTHSYWIIASSYYIMVKNSFF